MARLIDWPPVGIKPVCKSMVRNESMRIASVLPVNAIEIVRYANIVIGGNAADNLDRARVSPFVAGKINNGDRRRHHHGNQDEIDDTCKESPRQARQVVASVTR